MPIRNIIKIDEDKCNGCGQCIVDCAEGALAIVDGKAKLVRESYCDGLGACLSGCPTGALTLEQREVPEFELPEEHAAAPAARASKPALAPCPTPAPLSGGGGCPGARAFQFNRATPSPAPLMAESGSALTHWPAQLRLVNFAAPHYHHAEILSAADCTAFALGAFHALLLQGKSLAIACPKLDDPQGYVEKLADMFRAAQPPRVTVARMEVPCCRGITHWVLEARKAAGSNTPVEEIVVGVEGSLVNRSVY